MLRIWGRNTSINVQKVLWAIGELGIAHERIDVGGSFGKNNEPEYLAKNPNGLVPTLEEEDGFILWESNTVVRYLAAKHGMGTLEPSDPKSRARASSAPLSSSTSCRCRSCEANTRSCGLACPGSRFARPGHANCYNASPLNSFGTLAHERDPLALPASTAAR